MICKQIACKDQLLNEPKLIFLHKVKLFQVIQCNTNSFICTVGFKYFYVILIFQFNSHLFAHS